MNKEALQIYTARITQASKSELIVIMYDIILDDIKEANAAYEEGNIELFEQTLKHAQKFLNELMGSLNYKYVMALDLVQLYIYVNKRLITAIVKKSPETLESAKEVMERLKIGFEGISKEDQSGPVMKNTQQLYAGLTYGKGTLNETFLDPTEANRGYKA